MGTGVVSRKNGSIGGVFHRYWSSVLSIVSATN